MAYRNCARYTGNLKQVAFQDMVESKPTEVLRLLSRLCVPATCLQRVASLNDHRFGWQAVRLAVRGMLPKNKLRDRIMAQRLFLYEGDHDLDEHATTLRPWKK